MEYMVTLTRKNGKIEDIRTDDPMVATLKCMLENRVIKSFSIRLV